MSEQIIVTFDVVQTAAEDLADTTAQMQEILQGMQADLRPLEADWTGAAAAAYQAAQAEWEADLTEMVDLLDTLSGVVTSAGEGYRTTEDSVRDAWG